MTYQYENLRQFFGGYFHEDWNVESNTDADVVALFVHDSSKETLDVVISELDELIRQCTRGKENAETILPELWCYYYYQADGLNGLEWLQSIRSLLLPFSSHLPS